MRGAQDTGKFGAALAAETQAVVGQLYLYFYAQLQNQVTGLGARGIFS
jgi:hypothetical protein